MANGVGREGGIPADRGRPNLAHLAEHPAQLRAALEEADAATLMLVLVQFTGDADLLHRAAPHITGPLNYHESMPADLRDEIRDRLTRVLIEHAKGTRPLPPIPEGDLLRAMLSTAAGEDVAEDYTAMMREDLEPAGTDPRGMVWRDRPAPERLEHFPVAIPIRSSSTTTGRTFSPSATSCGTISSRRQIATPCAITSASAARSNPRSGPTPITTGL